jgi:hypothetical protein
MEFEPAAQTRFTEYFRQYRRRLWKILLPENVRFCYNARGSLEETLSHLVFAFEAKYIPATLYDRLQFDGQEIDKMLNGYISYLKKSKQGAQEPGINPVDQNESEPLNAEPVPDSIDPKNAAL